MWKNLKLTTAPRINQADLEESWKLYLRSLKVRQVDWRVSIGEKKATQRAADEQLPDCFEITAGASFKS